MISENLKIRLNSKAKPVRNTFIEGINFNYSVNTP